MIHNYDHDDTPYQDAPQNVIQRLLDIPSEFFLCGSRDMHHRCSWLGSMNPIQLPSTTDWDFFVQDTPDIRQNLRRAGFTSLSVEVLPSYLDALASEIFECSDSGIKVQVVIRSDAELYKTVWDSIMPDTYIKLMWKSSRDSVVPSVMQRDTTQLLINQLITTALSSRGKSNALYCTRKTSTA